MGLFSRKANNRDIEMAKIEGVAFWNWFLENDEIILKNLTSDRATIETTLAIVMDKLKRIFPKYKKELCFGFAIQEKWFDIAHCNSPYLMTLMEVFKGVAPKEVLDKWKINITE